MKQWLYHEKEDAKIFEGEEITKALKKGWVDTPAKFKKNTVIDVKETKIPKSLLEK